MKTQISRRERKEEEWKLNLKSTILTSFLSLNSLKFLQIKKKHIKIWPIWIFSSLLVSLYYIWQSIHVIITLKGRFYLFLYTSVKILFLEQERHHTRTAAFAFIEGFRGAQITKTIREELPILLWNLQ